MNAAGIAFVFPGQGAQRPGMLGALPAGGETARTMREAADTLGPIAGLDAAGALASTTNASTTNTQLALLICGVAAARTLAADHGVTPGCVAGHSAGAFAAAVTAGVLTFAEALRAVRLRGELMAAACAAGRWGMAAVTGLRPAAVRDVLGTLGGDRPWIANINAADQVVLGGTVGALGAARDAARAAGARDFRVLDVSVASHGPLQAHTALTLAEHLAEVPIRHQRAAYLTDVGARRISDDARAVLHDLADGVAHPVRWYDIVRLLPELGVEAVVEMPPGDTLTRLTAASTPRQGAYAVAELGFDTVAARLRAH